MKSTIRIIGFLFVGLFILSSCNDKYAEFNNGQVVVDTYSGTVDVTSGGSDPAGDFVGNGDVGTYSFAWENSQKKASLNFDITTSSGSVQMILNDANGDEVLNEILRSNGEDTFSGVSKEGKKGTWLVSITLSNFNGDGSYSIHPGN